MTVVQPTDVDAPSLEMVTHVRRARHVVTLRGEVERQTVPRLERYLEQFEPRCELELDLGHVEFMDVAGATLLTQTAVRFYQHGGRVRLCGTSQTADGVLRLLGMDRPASGLE